MTREIAAHHAQGVLASPHVGAALAIHRAAPGLSLVELLERAGRPGPASRAIEHARECAGCRIGALCPTGQRLARQIRPSRPRPRRAASGQPAGAVDPDTPPLPRHAPSPRLASPERLAPAMDEGQA
jgi:hypothetical protein